MGSRVTRFTDGYRRNPPAPDPPKDSIKRRYLLCVNPDRLFLHTTRSISTPTTHCTPSLLYDPYRVVGVRTCLHRTRVVSNTAYTITFPSVHPVPPFPSDNPAAGLPDDLHCFQTSLRRPAERVFRVPQSRTRNHVANSTIHATAVFAQPFRVRDPIIAPNDPGGGASSLRSKLLTALRLRPYRLISS